MSFTIFSDGGSRGNPGKAACAYNIIQNDEIVLQNAKYLGITTNNVAEYNGVIFALTEFVENIQIVKYPNSQITFKMDSELVVKQLSGVYAIKNKDLMELAQRVKVILKTNNLKVKFVHIPRKENYIADKLLNEKLDDSSRNSV